MCYCHLNLTFIEYSYDHKFIIVVTFCFLPIAKCLAPLIDTRIFTTFLSIAIYFIILAIHVYFALKTNCLLIIYNFITLFIILFHRSTGFFFFHSEKKTSLTVVLFVLPYLRIELQAHTTNVELYRT